MRSFLSLGSFRRLFNKDSNLNRKLIFPACTFYRHGHYETLGVKRNATKEEIRNAYLAKSKLLHPDSNPGDDSLTDKFTEVNEAYSVLGNLEKKRDYDSRYTQKYTHQPGIYNSPIEREYYKTKTSGQRQRSSNYDWQDDPAIRMKMEQDFRKAETYRRMNARTYTRKQKNMSIIRIFTALVIANIFLVSWILNQYERNSKYVNERSMAIERDVQELRAIRDQKVEERRKSDESSS